MNENSDSKLLDEKQKRILSLYSKNSKISFRAIASILGVSVDVAFNIVKSLEHQGYITGNQKSEYHLTEKGSEYLQFNASEPVKTQSREIENTFLENLTKKINDFIVRHAVKIWWMLIISIVLFIIGLVLLVGTLILNFLASRNVLNLITGVLVLLVIPIIIGRLVKYIKKSFQSVEEPTVLVIFRSGVCIGEKGPGLILVVPFCDEAKSVNKKVNHKELKEEACITQDNVQLKVDFVYWWKIQDAEKSITQVNNASESIEKLATGGLRAVIASFDFNALQEQRQNLNERVQIEIGEISKDWGIVVTNVEIQEVNTSEGIRIAMEEWRTAKWKSEATKKLAEGEAEALKVLRQAAYKLDSNTLNLEYFKTLKKLGEGQATKYFFPIELLNLAQSLVRQKDDKGRNNVPKENNPPEITDEQENEDQ